jgi:hypothetical protein
MLRKILTVVLSMTFVWMQTSFSFAENIHYLSFNKSFNSYDYQNRNNRGMTAKIGLQIPFGVNAKNYKESLLGLKLTYGQKFGEAQPFKNGYVRELTFLDSRFNSAGLRNFKLANQELLGGEDRHFIFGNGNGTGNGNGNGNLYLILGLAVVAGGACWALGCFDGDDSSTSSLSN